MSKEYSNKHVLSLNKNCMPSKNNANKNETPQDILRYIDINRRKISPQKAPSTEKKQENSDDPLKKIVSLY